MIYVYILAKWITGPTRPNRWGYVDEMDTWTSRFWMLDP